LLLAALAVVALGFLAFVALDAKAAFDGNPATPTLSSKLKAWRHQGHSGGRTLAMTAAIFVGGFGLIYLFGHLVLELW
jgi:hypothetical protein